MILKILGSLIVLISTTLFGIQISHKYRTRPLVLSDMIRCLEYLITQISYGQTSLPESFDNLCSSQLSSDKASFIFKTALKTLKCEEGITIGEAFDRALDSIDLYLNKQDKNILKYLSPNLGNTDAENQIKSIKLVIQQLSGQLSEAEQLRQKNEKLFKELGFLFGLMIIILLV